jgi:hypothetical protein
MSDRWTRDMDWAVTSPFLMLSSAAIPTSIPISEPQIFEGHRVGYYFEALIGHWLTNIRQVEMLAQGYQVKDGKQTLGELDFVFRDETGQVNHWEVAAKFFLYDADHQLNGSHFIGPNTGDTFERKCDKILHHQLPLSEHVFPEISCRTAFVKGRIFYHPGQKLPTQLPDQLSPDHLRGTWLRSNELDHLETPHTSFTILQKPFWLSSEKTDSALTFPALKQKLNDHFSSSPHPVLLAALHEGIETNRFFIVPENWPN